MYNVNGNIGNNLSSLNFGLLEKFAKIVVTSYWKY